VQVLEHQHQAGRRGGGAHVARGGLEQSGALGLGGRAGAELGQDPRREPGRQRVVGKRRVRAGAAVGAQRVHHDAEGQGGVQRVRPALEHQPPLPSRTARRRGGDARLAEARIGHELDGRALPARRVQQLAQAAEHGVAAHDLRGEEPIGGGGTAHPGRLYGGPCPPRPPW
jgi:hypothetical protein